MKKIPYIKQIITEYVLQGVEILQNIEYKPLILKCENHSDKL